MLKMSDVSTVALRPETKVKLNMVGKKGQTYDQIISALVSKILEEKN